MEPILHRSAFASILVGTVDGQLSETAPVWLGIISPCSVINQSFINYALFRAKVYFDNSD